MRRLFRLAVVLALALAVPLQGAAAASAVQCMALGHHGGDTPSAHSHDGAPAHHHDHDGGAGGGTHDAHCPPCASCCATTAAVAAFPSLFVPERPASGVATAIAVSFSGIPPERLDRPPLAL